MARRVAFLIGTQTFQPDSGFQSLQGPANDIAALARPLRDPERGKFEVHEFLDKTHYELLPKLEQTLRRAALGDLFLIYYSGHGKVAQNGHLCLATANTSRDALHTTSIRTRDLHDLVEESNCDQVVLILDCCFSGAVDGLRSDVGSALHVVDDAHGFYIMTATTDTQTTRETPPISGGVVMGRFTATLVKGIESGAADRGCKGKILLSDLRDYVERADTGSTPQFFARRANGDPLISLSPATAAQLLGSDLHSGNGDTRSRTTRFRDVCRMLPRIPENGIWYRLILPKHYATALSSAHNKKMRSRFNAGPLLPPADQFTTLYLADDPIVAQFEMGAVLGSLTLPASNNFVTLNVRVVLAEIIDLTDVNSCQLPLGISAQELTGDWAGYTNRGRHTPVSEPMGISPTQELGKVLFDAKIEGFLTFSARVPYHKILVVFIDNLRLGSSLTFIDPSGTVVHRIP